MALVPARFMIRMAYPCRFIKKMPAASGVHLFDLPASCMLDNHAEMDDKKNFADVRLAWNHQGIAVQASVTGKEQLAVADVAKPRFSDGVTIWIDTRGDRNSHRASRYCHQFHFLPTGGGPDKDEPAFLQTKINRALADAPLCDPSTVLFRCHVMKTGYRVEAFIRGVALTGFDPDEHGRLGIYYVVRDREFGEQVLSVGSEFPYSDDPSLWATLELVK